MRQCQDSDCDERFLSLSRQPEAASVQSSVLGKGVKHRPPPIKLPSGSGSASAGTTGRPPSGAAAQPSRGRDWSLTPAHPWACAELWLTGNTFALFLPGHYFTPQQASSFLKSPTPPPASKPPSLSRKSSVDPGQVSLLSPAALSPAGPAQSECSFRRGPGLRRP